MIYVATVACTYFAPFELIRALGQKYAIIGGKHYRKSELSTISSGDKGTV